MTKEVVQIALSNMPDKFPLDDLFERLIFREKVEQNRKDAREGRTITIKEAKEEIKKIKAAIEKGEKDIEEGRYITHEELKETVKKW